jgi:hypothetical protein
MDVCAFIGVAPRGPARVPVVDAQWPAGYRMVTDLGRPLRRSLAVPVQSFDEYRGLFGGFEGPGLMPHAVASYFEQGGRLAWIVRIVPADPGARLGDGCASSRLAGPFTAPIELIARNPGSWGDRLRVAMALTTSSQAFEVDGGDVTVAPGAAVMVGSTLRFTDAGDVQTLALVTAMTRVRDPARARECWRLGLDVPPVAPERMELVEASIEIDDGAGQRERFERMALVPDHPDGLANVLCNDSTLIWPHPDWAASRLVPANPRVELLRAESEPFSGGEDAWGQIVGDDFFDPTWTPAAETPGDGLSAVIASDQVTQVVLPDLYVPAQWAGDDPVEIAGSGGSGASFAVCADIVPAATASAVAPSALTNLILDPRTSAGLDQIIARQHKVLDFCEATANHIALLDVPPGLSQGRVEQWRAAFDSRWGAAYHPWLIPARRNQEADDSAQARRRQLPPSAVAAGIIAQRELAQGIQFGPANAIAREIIHLAEPMSAARADLLHPQHINCFLRQPDGIRLIAARSLSRESAWRQLSVRRLMLMLCRTLRVETQWAVFEPNGPALWRDLEQAIQSLLRGLFRAGAFAGRSEAESFFVRTLTDAARLDRGELLVEIGVAPAEPLEFILVRLRRDGDGTLNLEH